MPLAPVDVEGPITGGRFGVPHNPMPPGLPGAAGVIEEEFFVRGDATAYEPVDAPGDDGRWDVRPTAAASYTTRILVRRPREAERFNGVVVVEWLNVSAGRDADPLFGLVHPLLFADGYAYVGVSAQAVAIEGGDSLVDVPGVPKVVPLKRWDRERYSSLHHPGDDWSFDIFSQIGGLLRAPGQVDPLAGLVVEHVVAVGQSQSAMRLATYANAIQPVAGRYDGILNVSRGAMATAIHEHEGGAVPTPARVRTDVDVPVLQLQTETDVEVLSGWAARQPDSARVVTWEIAGAAHADREVYEYGLASAGVTAGETGFDLAATCGSVNDGPFAAVARAALEALRAWVVDGEAPTPVSPIETADGGLVRDQDGNARGGVRTPAVDAPVSTLTGRGEGSIICLLFGTSTPLPPERLAERYPTHEDYVRAVTASADAAVAAGHLLATDRDRLVAEAEAAPVPVSLEG